jgi:hypothetical protein
MNRHTLRSNKKNQPPNALGIAGRPLTNPSARFSISKCFKHDTHYLYLDHTNVHDPTLLPRHIAMTTSDIVRESGIYTWILTKVGERYEIVGSKALTEYEIGSKHRDLYFDAGRPTVYAAGEVQVQRHAGEVEVLFNFESGTFMKDIMKDYTVAQRIEAIEIAKTPVEYYRSFIEPLWARGGATIVRYTDESLMSKLPDTLTKSVIDGYRKAGYMPYQFESSVECDLYRMWQLRKHFMGDTRDYLTFLKEEFTELPKQFVKEPSAYKGGRRKTRRKK